jgi:hypothetical protein
MYLVFIFSRFDLQETAPFKAAEEALIHHRQGLPPQSISLR